MAQATQVGCELKWLTRGRRGFYVAAYTENDIPGGSTKPGAESDVYDDLVFSHRSTSFVNAQCRITTGEFTQIKPQLRRSPAETAEPIEMLLDVWTRVGGPTGIGSGSSVSVCGYRSSYIENSWPVVWKFVKICEFYEFLELIEFAFSVYVGAVRRVYTSRDDGHRGRVNRCKNGWTNWDAAWGVDSGRPKETGIKWGSSVSVCGYRSSQIEKSWPIVAYRFNFFFKFVKFYDF